MFNFNLSMILSLFILSFTLSVSIKEDGVVRIYTSGAELLNELAIAIEAVDVAVGITIACANVNITVVGVHFHHVDAR